MISYVKKDITTVEHGIVVHGVNCQGVMGSGVALAVRQKWRKVYDRYIELCKGYHQDRHLLLGAAHYIKVGDDLYVGNWFTQVRFGKDGQRYADPKAIEQCLEHSAGFISSHSLPVYMPKIGCGLGGLDWANDVEPVVNDFLLANRDVELYVCDI